MRGTLPMISPSSRPPHHVVAALSMPCPVRLHGQRCLRTAQSVGLPSQTTEGLRYIHYDCGEHRVHASVPPHLWWDDCIC